MEWEQQPVVTEQKRQKSLFLRALVVGVQKFARFFSRHWLFFVNGFWALLLFGALLAPTFMALGWDGVGRVTYTIYSFTCHQLPERSFFLFGEQEALTTYGLDEVVAAGADPSTLLTLRQYVGSPEMGWKLGFSDRMVSMYGGAFIGGLLYWLFSRRRPMAPIPGWLVFLMVLPMAVDGTTHLISEITSLGFRDTNTWAVGLFGEQPAEFYTGTTFGTLNSHLRLITGLLFGIGMMLFAYPLMGYSIEELRQTAGDAFERMKHEG
ncbi:MAG: DUF2085 domain-containing protein [Chloroflexota bacterium]|nr:DUF2085 domain-containing protein [Chloroflexota bacterium]